MADQIELPLRILDASGDPVSGAKLYFYEAGTATPLTVYTTEALSVAHPSPLVADSGGYPARAFYDGSIGVRVRIYTAADVELFDIDPAITVGLGSSAEDISFDAISSNPNTNVQAAIAQLTTAPDFSEITNAAAVRDALGVAISTAGSVTAFAADSPPDGWLECDGSAISRTTYDSLFDVIGTVFGTGDGSTTFNIPDLRGTFLRGWDNGRGLDGSRSFGSYQADAFQGHYHNIVRTGSNWSFFEEDSGNDSDVEETSDKDAGNRNMTEIAAQLQAQNVETGAHGSPRVDDETRPKNVALMFCIKY